MNLKKIVRLGKSEEFTERPDTERKKNKKLKGNCFERENLCVLTNTFLLDAKIFAYDFIHSVICLFHDISTCLLQSPLDTNMHFKTGNATIRFSNVVTR